MALGIGTQVEHPTYGPGVIVASDGDFHTIYFNQSEEAREIGADYDGLTVLDAVASAEPSLDEITEVLSDLLDDRLDDVPRVDIASRWIGGTIVIRPGSDDLKTKEVPVESFFQKIIMVRERLRVLEQNINNHEKLDAAEKLKLQQYITRAYGSLTTFNVLFAHEEDRFRGSGGSGV